MCPGFLTMDAQKMGTEEQFYRIDIGQTYGSIMSDIERIAIAKALERSFGNQVAASKMLGLHRNTLRAKIRKFNIDVWRFKK